MVCENIFTTPPLPFLLKYGAFRHKIDYVTILREILNLEGHPNRITGSKAMAILLNGWSCIGWSCIGKGLRLQPAQQVCYLTIGSANRYVIFFFINQSANTFTNDT